MAFVGYLLSIVVALVAPLVLAPLLGAGGEGEADRSFLALPVQYLLLFVLGALLVRLWLGRRWHPEALGLTFPGGSRPWVIGALGGVAFVAIGQLGSWALSNVGEAGTKVAAQVGLGESVLRDVTMILSMAVLAPLGEEMIYRGVMFGGLHDACARARAGWLRKAAFVLPALVTSLLFAISHGGEGQSKQLLFLLIAGLIYAGIYWWTGSLTVAVLAHSVTNAVNVVLLATSGSGLTTPALWLLVAAAPLLSVGALWLLRRLLPPAAASMPRTLGEHQSNTFA